VGGCFFMAQKEMWELCLVDGGKDVVVEIVAEEEHLAALLVHLWSSDVALASLAARLFRYDQAGAIGNIETRWKHGACKPEFENFECFLRWSCLFLNSMEISADVHSGRDGWNRGFVHSKKKSEKSEKKIKKIHKNSKIIKYVEKSEKSEKNPKNSQKSPPKFP
jgi:hypothetical protein